MRTEHPLGTARHDEGDFFLDSARGDIEMRRECIAQRGYRIFAGEIVDPAIALGLAEHGKNGRWSKLARVDKRHESRNVTGTSGGNADDVDRNRTPCHSASPLGQKINRRSVKPIT